MIVSPISHQRESGTHPDSGLCIRSYCTVHSDSSRTHNVALMAHFESVQTKTNFVIVCTHLYWDPKDNDVKVQFIQSITIHFPNSLSMQYYQMEKLLKEVDSFNKKQFPLILAGDLVRHAQAL